MRQTNGPHCGFSFKEVHFSLKEKGINIIRFLPEGHIDTNVALITVKSNGLLISKPDLKSKEVTEAVRLDLESKKPPRSHLPLYLWNGAAFASVVGLALLLFQQMRKRDNK
jgi:hypothetical protein